MEEKKIKNLVHNFVGKIFTTSGNFRNGIYQLKDSSNFGVICKTADTLLNHSNAYHKHLYGNPLPDKIENLGVSKHPFYPKNLRVEIEWFLLSLRKYKVEITLFLNFKNDFEKSFILGDYVRSLEAVENSIQNCGYSLWAITSKLLIFEYTNAPEKAKLLATEVLEKNKLGVHTSSLINFISQRSERKLSANKFDSDLKNAVKGVRSNIGRSNQEYYKFKLNFFEHNEYFDLKDILGFDYYSSVVDRYLTFRKVLFYCACNGVDLEYTIQKISYVVKKVSDNFFDSICMFSNSNLVHESYYNSKYLKIVDLFYTGLYTQVCNEIKEHIHEDPCNFTLINLYSRSLVFEDKNFTPLVDNPSLLNEIAENIFKIYKRTSTPSEPIYSLYQASKNIIDFDLNYQLNSFIKQEQNSKINRFYFYFSLSKADPKLSEILVDKKAEAKIILENFINKTYGSIAVNYKLNCLNGDYDSIQEVTNKKTIIDKAKSYYDLKEYSEALKLWIKIYEQNENIPPIFETAIDHIFKIFSVLEKIDEAIKWYVNSFLKNQYSVYKVDTSHVQKALKKGRFKNVQIDIFLPIFISLVSSDENEKSFAIELFCKKFDALLPSDLINNTQIQKDRYLELFFFISCNDETLKHYRNINSTKRRLEERITICDFLATQYSQNQEVYIQEINLLTNELIIYEGTQKLDESKIYANDQAILSKELDEFEGLYNRYITIAGLYLKNIKILTINKNELRYLNKKSDIDYSQNDMEYSNQAHLDTFFSLFSEIKDRFLFSKFGIVTYLSTRIRHGVFLGELRPEMEKHNLIFFKNKVKNKYEPESHWLKNPALNTEEKHKLATLITSFSDQIDTLINTIIKDNIQIKLNNENPEGWFDYEFDEVQMNQYAVTLFYEDNYKMFCKKVLEILWHRTDANLERIRETLQEEVKPKFINILNNFESALSKLLGKNKMPGIFTALNSCSTNIQVKIDKIASWFKRSGKTHSDFKLTPLINIITINVQKSHPLKNLNFSLTSDFDFPIKGEYYELFSDFIRIFIDNMLKHSTDKIINSKIVVETNADTFEMIFENDSAGNEIEIPLEDYGLGVQIDGLKLITEDKSGFIKARKTIKDDLKNASNEIYIKAEESKFIVTVVINYSHLII